MSAKKQQTVTSSPSLQGLESAPATMVVVGRVGAPFGVQGFLKIQSFTDPEKNILEYGPWFLKIRDQWQSVPVTEAKALGQQLVARFDEITDRDEARRYTNCEIGVDKSVLPDAPEGEYYWNDLIGLNVINAAGDNIGVVTALMETGSNDVLVVAGETGEFGIPFLMGNVIINVNLKEKVIHVNWDHTGLG